MGEGHGNGMTADKIAHSVKLLLIARIAVVVAPFLFAGFSGTVAYFISQNTAAMDKLGQSVQELRERRDTDREQFLELKGEMNALRLFAADGGRYTQEEANKDWANQARIDGRQTTQLDGVRDRLELLARSISNSTP